MKARRLLLYKTLIFTGLILPVYAVAESSPWQTVQNLNSQAPENYTPMDSPMGAISVPYQVVNGRAIYGGDVDLGPVSKTGEVIRPRGSNPQGTTWKWPNGDIPYVFDPSSKPADQQKILQTMQYISQNTAIKFHPRIPQENDYLNIIPGSEAHSGVGRNGGKQDVHVAAYDPHSIVHELGHALGLYHEHQRHDRNEHITYHPECVAPGRQGDFNRHLDDVALEPYDIDSVMHYDAFFSSCNYCYDWCPTLANLEDTEPIEQTPFPQGENLTIHDRNSLIRMYPFIGSADEKGDRLGASLATGDFDGDGYDDLAAGLPGENLNAIPGTGLVSVYKGVHSPIPRSRTEMWPSQAIGGERFGEALTVGDFNGDGYDDLAIAAPGRDVDNKVDWGSVSIAYGSSKNLSGVSTTLTAKNLQNPQDCPKEFGKILSAGDFDRDGVDDLILGCAGTRAFVLLGQKNQSFVYSKTLKLEESYPNADLANSKLKTIAVSPEYYPDQSNGGIYLAFGFEVKDKSEAKKRGMAFRFSLIKANDFYAFFLDDMIKSTYFDDGLGSSLAFLNKGQLAVGIPQADIVRNGKNYADAGEVKVYARSAYGKPPVLNKTYRVEDFGKISYEGTQFGATLLAFPGFNSSGGDWLAIGAPFEYTTFNSDCDVQCPPNESCGCGGGFGFSEAGSVYVSQPGAFASQPQWKFQLMQAITETKKIALYNGTELVTLISKTRDPAGTQLDIFPQEYFGSAMAVRYGPEGNAHLIVGAPGNVTNTGGRLIEYNMNMKFGNQTSYIDAYRYRQRTAWKPVD